MLAGKNEEAFGEDIFLELQMEGFKQDEVVKKASILAEKGRLLPFKLEDTFVEAVPVPVNGRFSFTLSLRGQKMRIIRSESGSIPKFRLLHRGKGLYNGVQTVFRYIPVVGKPLESIAPDAKQKVTVTYSLECGEDRFLEYVLILRDKRKKKKGKRFTGSIQL